jgi:hypothetical protein
MKSSVENCGELVGILMFVPSAHAGIVMLMATDACWGPKAVPCRQSTAKSYVGMVRRAEEGALFTAPSGAKNLEGTGAKTADGL